MYVNGIVWTFYGISKIDATITIPNASSVVLGLIYTAIYFNYATHQMQTFKVIIVSLVIVITIVFIFALLSHLTLPALICLTLLFV